MRFVVNCPPRARDLWYNCGIAARRVSTVRGSGMNRILLTPGICALMLPLEGLRAATVQRPHVQSPTTPKPSDFSRPESFPPDMALNGVFAWDRSYRETRSRTGSWGHPRMNASLAFRILQYVDRGTGASIGPHEVLPPPAILTGVAWRIAPLAAILAFVKVRLGQSLTSPFSPGQRVGTASLPPTCRREQPVTRLARAVHLAVMYGL